MLTPFKKTKKLSDDSSYGGANALDLRVVSS
jgi:hypothetical protein